MVRTGRKYSYSCRNGTISIQFSSIGAGLASMTSQAKMAAMAPRWPTPIHDGVQAQIRVTTTVDLVTRSVSPRKVS